MGAQLERVKEFAKEFLIKHNIPLLPMMFSANRRKRM
jgi:phosphoribosylamine-glycine ligase